MNVRPSISIRVSEARIPADSADDVERWLQQCASELSRSWPGGPTESATPSRRDVEQWLRTAFDDSRGERR